MKTKEDIIKEMENLKEIKKFYEDMLRDYPDENRFYDRIRLAEEAIDTLSWVLK